MVASLRKAGGWPKIRRSAKPGRKQNKPPQLRTCPVAGQEGLAPFCDGNTAETRLKRGEQESQSDMCVHSSWSLRNWWNGVPVPGFQLLVSDLLLCLHWQSAQEQNKMVKVNTQGLWPKGKGAAAV